MIDSIEQSIVIPKTNRKSSIQPAEADYIYWFLKKNMIRRTAEIGFGYGYSAAYIVSATKRRHTVIDPYQSRYRNLGLLNMELLKLSKYIDYVPESSQIALPQLVREKRKFDFIFIDGGHLFDQIFIDFYYSDLLMPSGGYIMFHDLWMEATKFVLSWIRKNRPDYTVLPTGHENLALVKKTGTDRRIWTDFQDYYPKGFILCEMMGAIVNKLRRVFLIDIRNYRIADETQSPIV